MDQFHQLSQREGHSRRPAPGAEAGFHKVPDKNFDKAAGGTRSVARAIRRRLRHSLRKNLLFIRPHATLSPAGLTMNIKKATQLYEAWLARRLPLLPKDVKAKHKEMRGSAFGFMRATFYRWAQLWPSLLPELNQPPTVLGVGDLHVENFGTWRDQDGRLVWGINDFDEACWLPYTNDLVRLAASARLAIREDELDCDPDAAAHAVLEGYQDSLAKGGQPLVLADQHIWLRDLATPRLKNPDKFWGKLSRAPLAARPIPAIVARALRTALPEPGLKYRVLHRQAGLGSLGRRRFTALAEWRGGLVAREAKELTTTAWQWEQSKDRNGAVHYAAAMANAVRAADPFVSVQGDWIIRRLAADCSRIELASLPQSKDELRLLYVMGWETANIHLGTRGAKQTIGADLRRRGSKWLRKASDAMARATLKDWKDWRGR
jgi:hypothetical protein